MQRNGASTHCQWEWVLRLQSAVQTNEAHIDWSNDAYRCVSVHTYTDMADINSDPLPPCCPAATGPVFVWSAQHCPPNIAAISSPGSGLCCCTNLAELNVQSLNANSSLDHRSMFIHSPAINEHIQMRCPRPDSPYLHSAWGSVLYSTKRYLH